MTLILPNAQPAGDHSLLYRAPLLLIVLNGALLSLWFAGLAPRMATENGILETTQLLLVAGAFGAFMFAAMDDRGPIGTAGTALAAISAIAIIREIDVRKLVVPDWMMIWSYSPFRDTTVGALLVLVLIYTFVRRSHFNGWLAMLLRLDSWPLWLSGIFLTASMGLDGDKVISGELGVLIEELVEFNGYLLLLVASWRHCQFLTNRRDAALTN